MAELAMLVNVTVKQAKTGFFDRKAVIDAVGQAKAKALGLAGFQIRRRARSLIKKQDGPSQPGRPPRHHTVENEGIRGLLLTAWDAAQRSVVVGAARYKDDKKKTPLPALLEFGGLAWTFRNGGHVYRLAARPYMGPALNMEMKNIPEKWRGLIHR